MNYFGPKVTCARECGIQWRQQVRTSIYRYSQDVGQIANQMQQSL